MDKQLEESRVLRLAEVIRLTGLARATLYSMVAKGTFPPPIRLSMRSVGWPASVVYAWLQAPERRWVPSEVK